MRRRRSGLNFRKRKKKKDVRLIKEIAVWGIEIVLTILLAFTLVYFIGLQTSAVGQSMANTIYNGDTVLVNRLVYAVSDPKPNDIIVFKPNGNEKSHLYMKRVIGVPGDTVQIINGLVYVNGEIFIDEERSF